MSALHTYVLICDEKDCGARYCADAARVSRTREIAAEAGWAYTTNPHMRQRAMTAGRDWCPRHAPYGADSRWSVHAVSP